MTLLALFVVSAASIHLNDSLQHFLQGIQPVLRVWKLFPQMEPMNVLKPNNICTLLQFTADSSKHWPSSECLNTPLSRALGKNDVVVRRAHPYLVIYLWKRNLCWFSELYLTTDHTWQFCIYLCQRAKKMKHSFFICLFFPFFTSRIQNLLQLLAHDLTLCTLCLGPLTAVADTEEWDGLDNITLPFQLWLADLQVTQYILWLWYAGSKQFTANTINKHF